MKKVVKLSSEIGKQKTPQSIDLRGFFNSGGEGVRLYLFNINNLKAHLKTTQQ